MSRDDWQVVADLAIGRHASHTGWVRVCCPFCEARIGKVDRRWSCGWNDERGKYHCWRCEAVGFAPWGSRSGRQWEPIDAQPLDPREFIDPPQGYIPLASGPGATATATAWARDYLAERLVPFEAIETLGIGAAIEGRVAGRVIVPALAAGTFGGPWLGWVARDVLGNAPAKYLAAPGAWVSQTVWNEEALGVETDEPAIVVEGVFDALPHWPRAVALLGKQIKGEQMALLCASKRPLAVVLDGDAHETGWALAQQLRLHGVARVGAVTLDPGTDPGITARGLLRKRARLSLTASL